MWIRFIILLILPGFCTAEKITCNNFREGIYKVHGLYGSLNVIVRTNEKQIETSGKSGIIVEYNIRWTSECTYQLFNRHVISGNEIITTISNKDTLYNEIVELNKDWHKIVFTLNGWEPKVEENYFNVDTSLAYKDLNELEKLKEYNGPTIGATFLSYNYATTYKQYSNVLNKYVIAFLECLMFGEKSKFKIIDTINCTLDTNQKISISNCRYNDKYDNEIIVIYDSANPNEEARIIKSWRFNTVRLKIEEIDINTVKYKEADKNHIFSGD